MTDTYVAIDLETTGFSAVDDRIIEVGAVRFDREGHLERFATFVRPGRSIPGVVQTLTSITERDVATAPEFAEVLPALREFMSGCAVVGHNVQFDLGFLAAAGLRIDAPAFDTYDLASVLLPTAPRMQLGAIAATLGIEMPVAHRALADAEATAAIFLRLRDMLDALPRAVLLDLLTIAEHTDWGPLALIEEACAHLDARSLPLGAPSLDAARASLDSSSLGVAGRPLPGALVAHEGAAPVTAGDVDAMLALAGQRPDLLSQFESRPSQQAMARAVAANIGHGGHFAVEAGTGTGKSLAYLLPSLLHALRGDDRVVVSTHTLNLQEQLSQHDLPAAAAIVESYAGVEPGTVRTAVLKGRTNYLCLERWAEARATPRPRSKAEARLHARIAVWLPDTTTGELGEIAVPAADRSAWDALSAGDTDCLSRRCVFVRDNSCFLLRARAEAAAAHVLVVNHALLLANAATGDQVLPPFRHLVMDEAHRVEEVATQAYGAMLSLRELQSQAESTGGIIARLRTAAVRGDEPLSPAAGLAGMTDTLAAAAANVIARVPDLDAALRAFSAEARESGANERDVLITSARRAQPLWGDVEDAALQLDVTLQHFADRIALVRAAAVVLPAESGPVAERAQSALAALTEAVGNARSTLFDGLLRADRSRIVWLTEPEHGGGIRVHVAPLEVADRLMQDVYASRESVTATSATLSAKGSFDFSVRALGLVEPDTLSVPSPFDYRRAVLAIVVDDIPSPEAPGYADALHRAIGIATEAAGGRTLALFTSHNALRAAAGALAEPLRAHGIGVLAHNLDGPPARLLRQLIDEPRTLLLGTAAFWEGVDVRGETLSQIAMARLPFPVPSDPIYAGRAALYDDPFEEYAVPQAVLRFRQGFGRLIRGEGERGVFLLLDRRVLTRSYGDAFLDALPDCEVRRLPIASIGEAVSRWLA